MLSKQFIRFNKISVAIFLFLILFSTFHFVKPGFAYGKEGGFRPFGLGYRNKTVLPIWIASIVLAILSYIVVVSYIDFM
jgi:hypothetical protein